MYLCDLKCRLCLQRLENSQHLLHMIEATLIEVLVFLVEEEEELLILADLFFSYIPRKREDQGRSLTCKMTGPSSRHAVLVVSSCFVYSINFCSNRVGFCRSRTMKAETERKSRRLEQ